MEHIQNILNLTGFFLFQAAASLLFKFGATLPSRYWFGFIAGNAFGMSSIFMLINLYRVMNPNIGLAVCTGGAFCLNQIAMYFVYRQALVWTQWGGIALIAAGIAVVSLCGPAKG